MAAGHKAEERQFPFPFFTSQRDPPQLQPFRRAGRMHPSWGGAGRPVYCPVSILSHCLLENTLKIHLLRIVSIWDFPQEDWSSCLRLAAAKLSPGVEEEEVGGRCRCWGSSNTSKHKELALSSTHHLHPPAPSWQKLPIPASRGPPAALQDGEWLSGAGSHPQFPCGRLGLLQEYLFTAGRWQLGFCFGCTA